MMYLSSILALCTFVGLAASQSAPLPPSQDPWYTAPPNFEAASPGTVLRVRAAPGNLTAIYGNSSSIYNILYRTTDSNYKPAWAVTTYFIPKSQPKAAFVSYQIPYNTPFVDGSPSYALYGADFAADLTVGGDIQKMLSFGWSVSVPDHEGPLAAFGCVVSEGHATIDAIRAVKSIKATWAPPKNSSVAMWGYSGGSLASEFAAELQVQYAPELKIDGMAIGGLPTNFSETIKLASKTYFAGLVPAAFVGLSKQHPDWNRTLRASLKPDGPYNASTFLSVEHMTINQIFPKFQGQDVSQYFKQGDAIFADPTLNRVGNNDALMGYHGTPQMPMFIYKAVHDELCPIATTDALVDRYCGVGANIIYQRNSIGGHVDEETNDDSNALNWLKMVLGGKYNHTGCTVNNVAINIANTGL